MPVTVYDAIIHCAETVKNEYREMIDSFKAAWVLVGHKLKNHCKSLSFLLVLHTIILLYYYISTTQPIQHHVLLKKSTTLLLLMTQLQWNF